MIKHWKFILMLAILVAVICNYGIFSNRPRDSSAAAKLKISAEYLDFGTVNQQPDFEVSLPIENLSGEDIEIAEFVRSCTCTSIIPSSLSIPANSTRSVTAVINLMPKTAEEFTLGTRPFFFELSPRLAESDRVIANWRVHGKVASPLTANPPELYLSFDGLKNEDLVSSFIVRTMPDANISDIEVLGLPHECRFTVARESVRSTDFRVTITLDSSTLSERFSWILDILAKDSQGYTVEEMKYKIFGELQGEIIALPRSLVFNHLSEASTSSAGKGLTLVSRKDRLIRRVDIVLPIPEGIHVTIGSFPAKQVEIECALKSDAEFLSEESTCLLHFRVALDEPGGFENLSIPVYGVLGRQLVK